MLMKRFSSGTRALLLGLSLSLTLAACGGKTDPQLIAKPSEPTLVPTPEPAKLAPVIRCAP
jgi:hypothetical protein